MSSNVKIVELAAPSLENPILIQGLPGLGLVGKLAVDLMIDQLKPTRFAELYSSFLALPDGHLGVKVELDGTFTFPRYEFHAYTASPNIIFLTGDVQPSVWGQYRVAEGVLDYVEEYRYTTVLALGGYSEGARTSDRVYAIVGEARGIEDLRRWDVQIAQSGAVKSAFGVILGLTRSRGMRCTGLLGATHGEQPEPRATWSGSCRTCTGCPSTSGGSPKRSRTWSTGRDGIERYRRR